MKEKLLPTKVSQFFVYRADVYNNMKKNIAVVGCGYWGQNLVRNFSELGALRAISDPAIATAQRLSKKYKVASASFVEILNDSGVEGVVLATPARLHASMAIKALEAGKHVYVEKPIAMNQSEASEMILAAKEFGGQLMVGHLLQYHPVFVRVRELVAGEEIGALQYVYSNRLSLGKVRSEEDVIWSFAPHDISMILSLVPGSIKRVHAETNCVLRSGIADNATIHLQFESGLRGHVTVSWLHPFKEQKLVIIGDRGMVVFDDTQPWERKLAKYAHTISCDGDHTEIEKADIAYIEVPYAEPLKEECSYFLRLIEGEAPPLTDGIEGAAVLAVLNASSSK
ncbi:putative dehydrogenase [gamma proteobacterium HIMB55]|nr:putative dehydrogenase [gamma proteobacterium HIMB55]